jgi:type II restriction/modification system DNA methylase subunit YeeA
VLNRDGTEVSWPDADVIIGNPPFLGDKSMISTLGENYTASLRATYAGRVPGAADLVCYWFEKARALIQSGSLKYAGLVTTQAIRRGASRVVLDRIAETGTIYNAWADEPWSVEGAAVRVSVICFAQRELPVSCRLNGQDVPAIYADITGGGLDLTQARRLSENAGVCFQGTLKVGAFDIEGELARQWLGLPLNPNGCPNSDVVRPWANGSDATGRPSDTWIIDFPPEMREQEASLYEAPYQYVLNKVKPFRDTVRRNGHRIYWWRHGETRPGMRRKLSTCSRYIATPRVAKHRLFIWLDSSVLPDGRLRAYPYRSERHWESIDFPSFFEKITATGIGSKRYSAGRRDDVRYPT